MEIDMIAALTDLAEMEKANRKFYKDYEKETGICVAQFNQKDACHVFGLAKSGLELTKSESGIDAFPTKYSIIVNGIRFFEITEEPWED